MYRWIFALFIIGISYQTFSQNLDKRVNDLIQQGTELHDNGLYVDAIRKYEEALKIEPRNLAAKYEMAYAWYALGNYSMSMKYSKQVIDAFGDYWADAVMLYGSSLDNLGKTKRAIRLYEDALKKKPGYQLLRYNLALCYFKIHNTDKAIENVQKSISLNPAHGSSHLLLSKIMLSTGNKIKSIFPLYYFLIIEQDSERSINAYNDLNEIWHSYLNLKSDSLNHKYNSSNRNPFNLLENKIIHYPYPEDVKNDQLAEFINYTTYFLDQLKSIGWDDNDFWYHYYISFFNELSELGYGKSFSYYISNCKYKQKVISWVTRNYSVFQKFIAWMELK